MKRVTVSSEEHFASQSCQCAFAKCCGRICRIPHRNKTLRTPETFTELCIGKLLATMFLRGTPAAASAPAQAGEVFGGVDGLEIETM